MNQIMINAVEWQKLLNENKTLKAEVERLSEKLEHANGRIKLLVDEIGFAERGWTNGNIQK